MGFNALKRKRYVNHLNNTKSRAYTYTFCNTYSIEIKFTMGITVVGSLNYDLVTYTDRLPLAGETLKANGFETHAGGKGLNQTIGLARMRPTDTCYSVRMVGSVGADSFGAQLVDILNANNVDVSTIKTIEGQSTGVATIIVEEQQGGQNRILLSEGANGNTVYSPDELTHIFATIEEMDRADGRHFVVFQHEIPDPCSIMSWIKNKYPSFQIIFNPSPCKPLPRRDWGNVDVLIINEIEALQIAKAIYPKDIWEGYEKLIKDQFIEGYRRICLDFQQNLINRVNDGVVVITLGSQGAVYCSNRHATVGYTPSVNGIKVVDTTGAGDTFLGSLVTQLYLDVSLEEAISFATKASSLAIQRRGAAESIPTYSEVV